MIDSFKARLRAGDTLIGPIITLPAADVADLLSRLGFDYLWIDLEHSAMDIAHAQVLLQAAGGRCPCLIRVPEATEAWIKKALDTGCDGIIIPQVRGAAMARDALSWCFYPPQGRRGAAATRAHAFGLASETYVARANDALAVILQVEHIDAVREIDDILALPGIAALFIGPLDLSASLGLLGQVAHPHVQEAIEIVRSACNAAGMPVGIYVPGGTAARAAIGRGFTMIALGTDAGHLLQASQDALRAARSEDSPLR